MDPVAFMSKVREVFLMAENAVKEGIEGTPDMEEMLGEKIEEAVRDCDVPYMVEQAIESALEDGLYDARCQLEEAENLYDEIRSIVKQAETFIEEFDSKMEALKEQRKQVGEQAEAISRRYVEVFENGAFNVSDVHDRLDHFERRLKVVVGVVEAMMEDNQQTSTFWGRIKWLVRGYR